VALELRKHGFNAYALRGGFDAWRSGGFPLEPREGWGQRPTA
jgi:rhodanese-related sulfurtransferase